MKNLHVLETLLSIPRKHESAGEIATGRMLVEHFGFQEYQNDNKEAISFVRVIGEGSPILWSTHIDTVHADDAGTEQKIMFDRESMMAYSKSNNPLGADNAAGMWLLLEMIEAGVPGTYVYHRGEECGGLGSSAMVKWWSEMLATHTHAIAFDRRGCTDVITHQFSGRCCSERFANQLCGLLEMGYEPSDGGSFTDTANYTTLIPECTNVSVGYQHEHTSSETLDLEHLLKLRDKVIAIFKAAPELIVERKVTDTDDDRFSLYTFPDYKGNRVRKDTGKREANWYPDPDLMDEYDVTGLSARELVAEIKDDPNGYADLLMRFAEELVYLRADEYDEPDKEQSALNSDDEEYRDYSVR